MDTLLFADYESREACQSIRQPYYNLSGWPIENGIEAQLYQMNGYRVVSAGEDTFIKCEKKIQDGVILITEQPEEQISLKKTVLDPQENWNGNGFLGRAAGIGRLCPGDKRRQSLRVFPGRKIEHKRSGTRTAGQTVPVSG